MTKPDPFSKSVHDFMDVFMQRSMHSWSHFVKSTGLSMQQFSILMQLHYRSHCGISDISERFEITSAAASQLADKLVQSGLNRTCRESRRPTRQIVDVEHQRQEFNRTRRRRTVSLDG